MSKINNLSSGQIASLLARVKRLEQASPLSSSSIGRGRMRFYDGSVLLIENGALQVTGTATISGKLNVSGETTLTGPTSIDGPTDITGALEITGDTTITGDTMVKGDFEIGSGGIFKAGQAKIEPSGKITIGDVVLDPTSVNLISSPGGKLMQAAGGGVAVTDSGGSGAVQVSPGATTISHGSVGFLITDSITAVGVTSKTGVTANLHIDAGGRIWKVG